MAWFRARVCLGAASCGFIDGSMTVLLVDNRSDCKEFSSVRLALYMFFLATLRIPERTLADYRELYPFLFSGSGDIS